LVKGGGMMALAQGQDSETNSTGACARCGRAISSVAEIPPFGGSPGLVAFMCADWSLLTTPQHGWGGSTIGRD
jgi:hypothetical protein